MGRRVPKGENSIEHLIDVIQEYDQSEHGVEAVAEFARTGLKPPPLAGMDMSISSTPPPTPTPPRRSRQAEGQESADHHKDRESAYSNKIILLYLILLITV